MRPSGSSNKPRKVKPAFSASLSDAVFAGKILRTIWRASVAVRKYWSIRFMARRAKPFRLHCGKIPYETLTSPGPTSRARFTSMKPINRLLAQSNTPKERRGPSVRQLSWLFRMNVSTVAGVLLPPLTHLAISSSSPARWSAASSAVWGRRKITPSVNLDLH